MNLIVSLGSLVFFALLGLWFGRRAERAHYASIRERERAFVGKPAVSAKTWPVDRPVARAQLVSGSVVVSVDYFKRILAGFRMLVGGEMGSYSSLIDRARREAWLRMKEEAPDADLYVNCRMETSSISRGGSGSALGTVEVMAYATAVTYAPAPADVAGSPGAAER